MENFEDKIIEDIQRAVLKQVSACNFLQINHGAKRKLPDAFINKVWESIDWEKVIYQVKEKMETKICNAIIGNMETEIKTDIKSLLSVDGVRQKLRIKVYPRLMQVLEDKQ